MTFGTSLPLAMIGLVELAILLAAGCLLFGYCRHGGQSFGGTLLKVLAIGAVVAGVAMFWRSLSYQGNDVDVRVNVPVAVPNNFDIPLDDLKLDFDPPRFQRGGGPLRGRPAIWSLIVLGAGLIILGSLLFGREKTRPGALKFVTLLGVGAILYSLVTFFGDPPRHVGEDVRVVRLDRESPPERTPGRAKRPAIRPRNADAQPPVEVSLPVRVGEIPVEVELELENAKAKDVADEVTVKEEVATEGTEHPESKLPAEEPLTEPKPEEEKVAEEKAAEETQEREAGLAVAAGRPAWIGLPPGLEGNVYSMSIPSGPYTSVPECQRALDEKLVQAVHHYIDLYRGEGAGALVALPLSYIRQHLVRGEYDEIIESKSVGPMHQLHVRLAIDERARAEIDRQWRAAIVEQRLWYTGGGALLVLALLGTFYGYLKLDLKTGGAHKASLQLAATLVALIVVAGVLLARQAVHF